MFDKLHDGLRGAVEYAKVQRAIHDWIRDDAPVSVKMSLMPEHVAKLVDRICGSRTTVPDSALQSPPLKEPNQ